MGARPTLINLIKRMKVRNSDFTKIRYIPSITPKGKISCLDPESNGSQRCISKNKKNHYKPFEDRKYYHRPPYRTYKYPQEKMVKAGEKINKVLNAHDLIGPMKETTEFYEWTNRWNDAVVSYLSHHRVKNLSLVPGSAYYYLVQLALQSLHRNSSLSFTALTFENFLLLQDKLPTVQIRINKKLEECTILSKHASRGWIKHATFQIDLNATFPRNAASDIPDQIVKDMRPIYNSAEKFYHEISNKYSGDFRAVQSVFKISEYAYIGHVEFKLGDFANVLRPIALIDVATHIGIITFGQHQRKRGVYISSIRNIQIKKDLTRRPVTWVKMVKNDVTNTFDFDVYAPGGEILCSMIGVKYGTFQTPLPQIAHICKWKKGKPVLVDDSVRIVSVKSVTYLHEYVKTKTLKSIHHCFLLPLSKDEFSAYLRTLCLEKPDSIVSWVFTNVTNIKRVPKFSKWAREWKYCEATWWVRSLCRHEVTPSCVDTLLESRGKLSNLKLVRANPSHPKYNDDEICVRVESVGLNFRDVLNVLGMYPGDPSNPGLDFSGEVVAIGKCVSQFKIGDAVFGLPSSRNSLHHFSVSNERLLKRIPSGMQFEEAATLPVVLTTIQEAFVQKCKLKKGDRVLVHAASGGIGMMAIQYCKRFGCHVIATAGAHFKHKKLKLLGVDEITSSRNVDSFKQYMKEHGKVDVVLNSLSGEYISASVDALRYGGHFCEIGKKLSRHILRK